MSSTVMFINVLPRIQRLQRRVGAMSMKERKMKVSPSFRRKSSGWREKTQTFWLLWRTLWSNTSSR